MFLPSFPSIREWLTPKKFSGSVFLRNRPTTCNAKTTISPYFQIEKAPTPT